MKYLFKAACLTICLLFSFNLYAAKPANSSDSTITSDVKQKISSDSALSGTSINVTTSKNVVYLSGMVDSDTQASTATQIAQSTNGVRDVDTSKLNVKGSNQPLTDSYITAKIKGLFIREKLFGTEDVAAMSVKVETNNGVVSLSGTAENKEEATNAIKLAKTVSGVKGVKSTIMIESNSSNQQ